MNNYFQYLDKVKIRKDFVEYLSADIPASERLFCQAAKIKEITQKGIYLTLPDYFFIDKFSSSSRMEKIREFFSSFYENQDFTIDFLIEEPAMEEEVLPSVISSTSKPLISGKGEMIGTGLDPEYTFDNFVTGGTNQYAYVCAKAVAQDLGEKSKNPLYLWGGVGLGKTHLLHAIGNFVIQKNPAMRVQYLSCQAYLEEFLRAIQTRNRSLYTFYRYRDVDLILIDDIQYLKKTDSFQDEFFELYNTLYLSNKQLVFASDRPPLEIEGMADRIHTRLKAGILADIKLPDMEMRMLIIQNLAQKYNVEINQDSLRFFAESTSCNVRDLRGAFSNAYLRAKHLGTPINEKIIEEALCNYQQHQKAKLTPKVIREEVAKSFQIDPKDLSLDTKQKSISYPRQIAMYLIKEMTEMTLSDIAKEFNRKDHVTVIHATKKILDILKKKNENSDQIRLIRHTLEETYK